MQMFKDPENANYKMLYKYDNVLDLEQEMLDKVYRSYFRPRKASIEETKDLKNRKSSLSPEMVQQLNHPPVWKERNELFWQELSKAVLEIPEKNPVTCFDKLFTTKFCPPQIK